MAAIDCGISQFFHGDDWAPFRGSRCEAPLQNTEIIMAWTKPTITEVPASMEINMYACAKQK